MQKQGGEWLKIKWQMNITYTTYYLCTVDNQLFMESSQKYVLLMLSKVVSLTSNLIGSDCQATREYGAIIESYYTVQNSSHTLCVSCHAS